MTRRVLLVVLAGMLGVGGLAAVIVSNGGPAAITVITVRHGGEVVAAWADGTQTGAIPALEIGNTLDLRANTSVVTRGPERGRGGPARWSASHGPSSDFFGERNDDVFWRPSQGGTVRLTISVGGAQESFDVIVAHEPMFEGWRVQMVAGTEDYLVCAVSDQDAVLGYEYYYPYGGCVDAVQTAIEHGGYIAGVTFEVIDDDPLSPPGKPSVIMPALGGRQLRVQCAGAANEDWTMRVRIRSDHADFGNVRIDSAVCR